MNAGVGKTGVPLQLPRSRLRATTWSNSARIESVVSSLYVHASVAELSRTRLTDGLHLGRFSTRSNQKWPSCLFRTGADTLEGSAGLVPVGVMLRRNKARDFLCRVGLFRHFLAVLDQVE